MIIYKYFDVNGAEQNADNKSALLKCPTGYKDYFDSMFFVDNKEKKRSFDLFMNYLLFKELRSGKLKASSKNFYAKVLKKNVEQIEKIIKKTRVYKKQPDLVMSYHLALRMLNKKGKDIRAKFDATIDDVLKKIRESIVITCFGSSFDSTYLWSNYADSHKGICIEYEVNGIEYRKIEYKKEIPIFQLTRLLEIHFGHEVCGEEINTDDPSFWFALDPVFTKLDDYSNEEEVRFIYSKNKQHKDIFALNDLTLLKMPTPKRIFFGCETSEALKTLIKENYPGVELVQMKVLNSKKGTVCAE